MISIINIYLHPDFEDRNLVTLCFFAIKSWFDFKMQMQMGLQNDVTVNVAAVVANGVGNGLPAQVGVSITRLPVQR